ncbi:hypothetical protein BV25DRAFT_3233 [Artomyces pyxidatus]|uniref:Uncharacterized protein n=1 Tax=Artomyces pyxidatus TaxID=48021 RepID=A0ACB8TJ87_9AGAM|nr:hypothetical protein BV25DRAFT_3233 [Artomyces pyxidatus]
MFRSPELATSRFDIAVGLLFACAFVGVFTHCAVDTMPPRGNVGSTSAFGALLGGASSFGRSPISFYLDHSHVRVPDFQGARSSGTVGHGAAMQNCTCVRFHA